MIRFQCDKCGRKLSVHENHAGKKGRCPKCKNVIIVPQAQKTDSLSEKSESENPQLDSKFSAYDLTLLEAPISDEEQEQPVGETGGTGMSTEHTGKNTQHLEKDQDDSVTERSFPWPIDIFLYPANRSGLVILGVIIAIRWFSIIVVRSLGFSTSSLSPMVVIVVPLLCISIIVRVVLYMFFYWYLCECIQDSAEGGIRAPETIGKTPGLWELLWLLRSFICFVIFAAPVLVYYFSAQQTDTMFWVLFVCGVLLLPMGLLAFVMFDSILSGINPILLAGSIRSTFLPYCAMILVFITVAFFIITNVRDTDFTLIHKFIIHCAAMYLLMVTAHLLGWFYNRYRQQLNWDV